MRYKIYEMVKSEHLQKTEHYENSLKTTEMVVLELPDYYSGLDGDYTSVEEANQAIIDNKENAKYRDFCILPVVSVQWDGEID